MFFNIKMIKFLVHIAHSHRPSSECMRVINSTLVNYRMPHVKIYTVVQDFGLKRQ